MREELLKIYSSTYESGDTPSPGDATPGVGDSSVPLLQRKITTLEEENLQLHLEVKTNNDGGS